MNKEESKQPSNNETDALYPTPNENTELTDEFLDSFAGGVSPQPWSCIAYTC